MTCCKSIPYRHLKDTRVLCVPQGSVLGPILFLIYINDIVDQLNCNAYLFADDMKIFNAITTNTDHQDLQSDINTIAQWTNKWQLKLNVEKCKIMTVGRALLEPPHTYLLPTGNQNGSHNLCRVTEEKDLGILIDSDLQFENHILSKVKTCNRILGLIRRNFKNLDLHGFLLLHRVRKKVPLYFLP